jgi:hypothetical protein
MPTVRNAIKALISCAAVSLASTFITAALNTYGVIAVSAARWELFLAGIVIVGAVTTSDYLCDKSWKHVLTVFVFSVVLVGAGLFWLDGWAIGKKAEMDARAIPPPLPKAVTKPPIPPLIAYIKTTKRAPINIVIGNQNVTGNKIIGSQVCPGGICAGGDITGNPSITTIIAPHGRVLPKEKAQSLVERLKQTETISVAIVLFEPITNEMEQLGGQFQWIFREAMWGEVPAYKEDIRSKHITMLSGNLDHPNKVTNEPDGLHCIGNPEKSRMLIALLSEAGLACSISPEDLYPVPNSKPALTIFIGRDLSQ